MSDTENQIPVDRDLLALLVQDSNQLAATGRLPAVTKSERFALRAQLRQAEREPTPEPADPFAIGTPIVPGHPLYAQVQGQQVIEATLSDAGLAAHTVEPLSRTILARLSRHDPPILLCTADELKD